MLLKLCLAACIAIGVSAEPVRCKEIGTQYAVKGCSTEYYQCHNGKLSTMQCPSNLFFDINGLNCDYRDRVENCVLGNAEIQYGSDDLPSCETQSDGTLLPIQLKCTNKYVICDHGRAILRQCPYEQYYNPSIQRCDLKRNVDGCKPLTFKKTTDNKQVGNAKFKIPRKISGSYGAPGYQTNSQPSLIAPVAPTAAEPITDEYVASPSYDPIQKPSADNPASTLHDIVVSEKKKFDCTTREDGLYPAENENCAPFFWNCVNGQAFKYNCPKGLFFDEEIEVCGYRYEIPSCGGTRPAPTEAPVLTRDVPKVNFNCTGKETGYYPMGECVPEFVQCLENIATLIVCPAGTVFDANTTTCVFKSNCGVPVLPPTPVLSHDSSSAYQAPTADVPADHVRLTPPVVSLTPPPVPKIYYDCSEKKDGFYAIEKCKKEYVVCNTGIASIMFCHGDLVFNHAIGQCDYSESCLNYKPDEPRADVPVLGNCPEGQYFDSNKNACFAQPSVAPPAPTINKVPVYHSAPPVYSTPAASPPEAINLTPTIVPAPKPAPVYANCEKFENGAHPNGKCSPNYILCWEKNGVAGMCASSLVFNPKTSYCDHKSNVEDCPEYVAPTATVAPSIALNSVAVASLEFTPPSFSCKYRPDGIYGIGGCTQEFVQCYAEILTSSKCISNLYYNEDNGMCDYKENVVACGGKLHSRVPTSGLVQDAVAPHVRSPYATEEPAASPALPAFSCSNKDDGFYSQGCSSIYFACSQGTAIQNICPASLKFSQDSQHCDFENAVPECGGKLPVAVPEKKLAPLVAAASPDNSACNGKSDGIFSTAACSSNYLTCVAGSAFVQPCAGNLIFNEKNGACDYERNVEGCQSAQAPTQFEHAAPSLAAIPLPKASQPTFVCQGLSNRYYSTNVCSSTYAYCEEGRAIIQTTCPSQLIFDNKKQRCELREKSAECSPKTVPLAAAPTAPISLHSQPVTQSQTSRAEREQFCHNKNNGIYSNGCSRKYFVCSDKVTYSFHCEGGNAFDEVRARCLPPSEVQACVSSQSQAVQQAPPQMQQQSPPIQPVQSQVLQQTQPAPQYTTYQQAPSQTLPQHTAYYSSAPQQYVPFQQYQPAQQYPQYQFPADQPSYDQYGYGY